MKKSNIIIRKLEYADLDQVVKIHLEVFKDYFLSRLGIRFLKIFYYYFLKERYGIKLVAKLEDGNIIGFIVGMIYPERFVKRILLFDGFKIGIELFFSVIKNPIIIRNILLALKKSKNIVEYPGDCELMSFGVIRKYQKMGIGYNLERQFCDEAKNMGSKIIRLSTDKYKNEEVNIFYRKIGYELFNSVLKNGERVMYIYMKKI